MARPKLADTLEVRTFGLSRTVLAEIDDARKAVDGPIPSQAAMIRTLLREALDARAKRAERLAARRKK